MHGHRLTGKLGPQENFPLSCVSAYCLTRIYGGEQDLFRKMNCDNPVMDVGATPLKRSWGICSIYKEVVVHLSFLWVIDCRMSNYQGGLPVQLGNLELALVTADSSPL